MRVEFFPPDSVTEPRYWVRHEEGLAMMLGPGSIEWGSKRSSMERVDYVAGDLGMCPHHEEKWVGRMNTPHLQLIISDAALMAASERKSSDVELRVVDKFADPRLGALVAAVNAERVGGAHWVPTPEESDPPAAAAARHPGGLSSAFAFAWP